MKRFLSTRGRQERQERAPLLGSGPDGNRVPSEVAEHPEVASGVSSPAPSTHEDEEPLSPRTLNLQLGGPQQLPPLDAKERKILDRKIHRGFQELMSRQKDHDQSLKILDKANREVDAFVSEYNKEKQKAPVPPPKGTWFHAERKLYPQKKAEHDEKLKFILRMRQEVMDNDLPKARDQVERTRQARDKAKATYDRLRKEMEERRSELVEQG